MLSVSTSITGNLKHATPTLTNMYSVYGTARLEPGSYIFSKRPSALVNLTGTSLISPTSFQPQLGIILLSRSLLA